MPFDTDICAFGALNQDSYDMFAAHIGPDATLRCAGPYPNADGVAREGRPLRGEALEDAGKRRQLIAAVAADARAAGADHARVLCMPCMSMMNFHEDVEQALGRPVVKLADALAAHYAAVARFGVLCMPPAQRPIFGLFGLRILMPEGALAEKLDLAAQAVKLIKNSEPVEAVMREIVIDWAAQGVDRVLFARADAPRAEEGAAACVPGVLAESTFGVLAADVRRQLA
jgi:hypothetical protein